MQLPHMDANSIKKLNRSKVRRVTRSKAWRSSAALTSVCRSLYDLMMLDDAGRDEAVAAVRIYLVLLVLRKLVDTCYTTVGLDRRSAQGF